MGQLKPLVLYVALEDLSIDEGPVKEEATPVVDETEENEGDNKEEQEETENGEEMEEEKGESSEKKDFVVSESEEIKAKKTPVVESIMNEIAASKDHILEQYGISLKVFRGSDIMSASEMEKDTEGVETAKAITRVMKAFEKDRSKPSKKIESASADSSISCVSLESMNKVIIIYDMNLTKVQFNALVEGGDNNPILDGVLDLVKFEPAGSSLGGGGLVAGRGPVIDNSDLYLSTQTIKNFIQQQIKEREGQWNDITVSNVNVQPLVGSIMSINDLEKAIAATTAELELAKDPPIPEPAPVPKGKKAVAPVAPDVDEGLVKELGDRIALMNSQLEEKKVEYSSIFDELLPCIGPIVQSLLLAKNEFHSWQGDDKITVELNVDVFNSAATACYEASIGCTSGVWETNPLYSMYANDMNSLDPSLHSVGASLYCITRSVVGDLQQNKWAPSPLNHALVSEGVCKVILESKDTGKLSTLSSLHALAMQPSTMHSDVILCADGDNARMSEARAFRQYKLIYPPMCGSEKLQTETDQSTNNSLDDMKAPTAAGLASFTKHARFRAHITRILGDRKFPRYAQISAVDRALQETELLSFTSLSAVDFHRSNQLREFHQLLRGCAAKLDDFTGNLKKMAGIDEDTALQRKYFCRHSAIAFQQILANHLLKEPDIERLYYPWTDDMLLVLHWIPPHRRMASRAWDASMSVRTRQSFKEFEKLQALHPGKKVEKPAPCINISKKELDLYKRETTFLTPAGKSMAFVQRVVSSGDSWITIMVDDSIIGLRKYAPISAPVAITNTKGKSRSASRSTLRESMSSANSNRSFSSAVSKKSSLRSSKKLATMEAADAAVENTLQEPEGEASSLCKSANFFCDMDDVRFVVTASNPENISLSKPDKKGTVCVTSTFVGGLCVAVTSDNTIRIQERLVTPATRPVDYIGDEASRLVAAGGIVVRTLINGPFSSDVYHLDGSRTLVKSDTKSDLQLKGFYAKLISEAPSKWKYVRLESNGKIHFFNCTPGTLPEPRGTPCHSLKQIKKTYTDGETHAEIGAFRDGRIVVTYTDKLTVIYFPDSTRVCIHPKGNQVCISKAGIPTVELDVVNDRCCYGHSNGMQVPLSKGGDRIRSLIAMPDGTAIMVKYDITVTSKVNGSLKVVCRDRTVIKAYDGGDVVYLPRTSWDKKAEDEFAKECADLSDPVKDFSGAIIKNKELENGVTFEATEPPVTLTQSAQLSARNKKTSTKVTGATKKTRKASSSAAQETVVGQPPSTADIVAKANQKETFYNFNVDALTCHIQDYEYNHFYINLSDMVPDPVTAKSSSSKSQPKMVPNNPLNPVLNLAGEVSGMKPTAVTDSPIEPKLFVLHRDGRATEVVCTSDIVEKQNVVKICPDAFYVSNDLPTNAGDLGGGSQHSFFMRKRLGNKMDFCKFEEVFLKPRNWHDRKLPAAASLALSAPKDHSHHHHHHHHRHGHHSHGHHGHGHHDSHHGHHDSHHSDESHGKSSHSETHSKLFNKHVASDASISTVGTMNSTSSLDAEMLSLISPRIFNVYVAEEHPPLSSEGYSQLEKDITNWLGFRNRRVETINRFAVQDTRTQEEIDLDEKIKVKLKNAYKAVKLAKRKLREQAREAAKLAKAQDAAQQSVAPSTSVANISAPSGEKPSLGLALGKLSAPPAGLDAIGEEDDLDFSDDEDEDDYEDPHHKEVVAAFENFAVHAADFSLHILLGDVRAALVQLFSKTVTKDFLEAVYAHEGVVEGTEFLDFEEFSNIYYSALNMLEQDEELENENNSQHTVETLEGGSIDIESLHELMESPKHGPSKGFPAGSGMQFARNR